MESDGKATALKVEKTFCDHVHSSRRGRSSSHPMHLLCMQLLCRIYHAYSVGNKSLHTCLNAKTNNSHTSGTSCHACLLDQSEASLDIIITSSNVRSHEVQSLNQPNEPQIWPQCVLYPEIQPSYPLTVRIKVLDPACRARIISTHWENLCVDIASWLSWRSGDWTIAVSLAFSGQKWSDGWKNAKQFCTRTAGVGTIPRSQQWSTRKRKSSGDMKRRT